MRKRKHGLLGRSRQAWGDARTRMAGSRATMQMAAELPQGTRRRSMPMALVGFALLAGMFTAVSHNVMAVNFTTGNQQFDIYSNYLDARKVAGFLDPSKKQNGSDVGVADIGIQTARLAGLCAIAQESIGVLGTFSLMVTAGDSVASSFSGTAIPAGVTTDATSGQLTGTSATNAIAANNLYMNATALSGYGNKIKGMNLGQSADTVASGTITQWPTGQTAPTPGGFGLTADQLNVAGLGGKSYGLNLAGDITLPKLSIKVVLGSKGQADCSAS